MKLLVTGASGFIGARLVAIAAQRSMEVTATGGCRNAAERMRIEELRSAGIPLREGSLEQPQLVRELCEGQDVIIHLAAAQHEANVPEAYFHAVNVEGTRALLTAAQEARVGRFVYGSTIGVYGEAPPGTVLDESSPLHPDNPYGRSKLRAEQLVRECTGRGQFCIARISETYGPGDFRLLKLFKAIERGRFVMIGPGTNRRQSIHVDDLVEALLAASLHPAAAGETFVLAGEQSLTTYDLVNAIATAVGRPPPRYSAPLWPFVWAATLLESTLRPLGVQPPLHRRRLDFFRKSFVFSTAKARTLLEVRPRVDLARGTAQTAHWYREHGLLAAEAGAYDPSRHFS